MSLSYQSLQYQTFTYNIPIFPSTLSDTHRLHIRPSAGFITSTTVNQHSVSHIRQIFPSNSTFTTVYICVWLTQLVNNSNNPFFFKTNGGILNITQNATALLIMTLYAITDLKLLFCKQQYIHDLINVHLNTEPCLKIVSGSNILSKFVDTYICACVTIYGLQLLFLDIFR